MTTTSLALTDISALRSVSEQVLDRFSTCNKGRSTRMRKRSFIKAPVLGSLGPDIEAIKQKVGTKPSIYKPRFSDFLLFSAARMEKTCFLRPEGQRKEQNKNNRK